MILPYFFPTLLIRGSEASDLPGIARVPLIHGNSVGGLSKRDYAGEEIDIRSDSLHALVQFGSNNQTLDLIVDTSADGLWVMSSSNPHCSGYTDQDPSSEDNLNQLQKTGNITCNRNWLFNTSQSTTYNQTTRKYYDNSRADDVVNTPEISIGWFAYDDISYGGKRISNAPFAVAESTNLTFPTWGLAPTNGTSIPKLMKEQGVINHNAFSIWISTITHNTSELVFGAVDTSKYEGDLLTIPLIDSYDFDVVLNGISLYDGETTATIVSCATPATIGVTDGDMNFPNEFLDAIVDSYGAFSDEHDYYLPCNLTGGFTLNLSGIEISIPFSSVLLPPTEWNDTYCLTIMTEGNTILGGTFMRHAYAVFDLDNSEISIAQRKEDGSPANYQVISSTVPGAKQAPGYSNTVTADNYEARTVNLTATTWYPPLNYTPQTDSTTYQYRSRTNTASGSASSISRNFASSSAGSSKTAASADAGHTAATTATATTAASSAKAASATSTSSAISSTSSSSSTSKSNAKNIAIKAAPAAILGLILLI